MTPPLLLGEGWGEGRRLLTVSLLLLLGACGLPSAPGTDPVGRSTHAVVSGTAAPEDGAVVALVARRTRCAGDPPALLCTGALIAADVVLTAAHCLEVLGEDGQYEVFVGEQLLPTPRGRFLRVREVRVHPGYVPETHALDVALLRLAAPAAEPPLPLPAPDELPTPGLALRALGYGETRDTAAPAGLRRQGVLEVESVEPAAFRARPAPAMSCTGDSGGPVLGSPRGREVLLGVTVSGDFACRSEAVQVRVDAVLEDFVRPFLSSAPPRASAPLPPAQLCSEACSTSAQCPAGLACVADAQGMGRCMLLALREGAFSQACTQDAACGAGGTCARLESDDGADACRCFTPCDALTPATETGCAAGGGPPLALAALLLLALGRTGRRPLAEGPCRGA